LKNAYGQACGKYPLSSPLHRLFQTAIHTGKRVRTETTISEGAVSHSQVTVEILKKEGIDFRQKIVGIIGVNKITEDILKFLTDNRTVTIFLSNRSFEKAEELAKRYQGTAIRFDDKKRMLELTDILITATSAPHTIIKHDDISPEKEILIFDLAFPGDVETSLGELKGVKLYDLEEIERFAKNNLQLRNNETEKAEQIIEEEIHKFHQWYSRLQGIKA
jgi:glutamyl-tRNA reductase